MRVIDFLRWSLIPFFTGSPKVYNASQIHQKVNVLLIFWTELAWAWHERVSGGVL